jgi:hypothetical protein
VRFRAGLLLTLLGLTGCAGELSLAQTAEAATTCAADRGIGGTGGPARALNAADRGIGGTGVVGAITDAGRLCLDGLEIALGPDTVVEVDGKRLPAAALQPGQVVAVVLQGMQAARVGVVHAVLGPVEVANDTRMARIAGQPVEIATDLVGGELLRPGQWVAVSGLRRPDGTIVASRLDAASPGVVSITGLVEQRGSGLAIGSAGLRGRGPVAGQVMTVQGPYAGSEVAVATAQPVALQPFGAPLRHVVTEAFLSGDADRIRLGQGGEVRRALGLRLPSPGALSIVELAADASGEMVAIDLHEVTGSLAMIQTPAPATASARVGTTTTVASDHASGASGSKDGQGKDGAHDGGPSVGSAAAVRGN